MQKLIMVMLIAAGMVSSSLQAEKDRHCSSHDQHTCKESDSCCAPILITQKAVNKCQKIYTITKSGLYAFAEDITGRIVVEADNVCIDLCCHTLNGNDSNFPALSGSGFRGLELFNGFIENENGRGILIVDYEYVNLHDLSFYPVNDAIDIFNSSHGILKNIKANGNTISKQLSSAMIFIGGGSANFELTDIELSHCTSEVNAGKMLFINAADNIRMTRVHINNNEQDFNASTFFAPLFVSGVLNLEADDCEINDNSVFNQNGIFEFDNVITFASSNIIFRNCRFNNSFASLAFFLEGFFGYFTNGLVLENCQANGTRLEVSQADDFITGAIGILIQNSNNAKVLGCQANDTTNGLNISQASSYLNGACGIELLISTGCIIEESQANRTTIEQVDSRATGPRNVAIGVAVVASSSCIVRKTEADFTSGGGIESTPADGAFGIAILGESTDVTVTESSGSSTFAGKFAAGIISHSLDGNSNSNIFISKNVAHTTSAFNDSVPGKGYGIVLEDTTNASVSLNEANQNQTAGYLFGPLAGFVTTVQSQVTTSDGACGNKNEQVYRYDNNGSANKNVVVEGNSAQDNGVGYLFDPVTKNSCFYVHDNIAQGNSTSGFEQQGKFFGYWVSNYAACNGQDYLVESPIQLFEKSSKAIFKHRSGDKRLVGLANISIGSGK